MKIQPALFEKGLPHEVNENQTNRRYDICSVLVYRENFESFFECILTFDKKMDSVRESTSFGVMFE